MRFLLLFLLMCFVVLPSWSTDFLKVCVIFLVAVLWFLPKDHPENQEGYEDEGVLIDKREIRFYRICPETIVASFDLRNGYTMEGLGDTSREALDALLKTGDAAIPPTTDSNSYTYRN